MQQLHQVLTSQLFSLGGTPVSVATLLTALSVVLGSLVVSRLTRGALRRVLRRADAATPGGVEVVSRLVHYTVVVLGLLVALQTAGIKLTAVLTAGAAFAVGFGLAIQGLAQNIVSGVLLLLERTIKPGDIIEVEGNIARVTHMGIRATIVRTLDDEELIVPNSTLVQSTVKNYTLSDREYRLNVAVGVSYGSDMKVVRRALEEAARGATFRADREPLILLTSFGTSSVDWEVSLWVKDPWRRRRYESDLRQAVWDACIHNRIVIAFPQLDVHFDPVLLAAMAQGQGKGRLASGSES